MKLFHTSNVHRAEHSVEESAMEYIDDMPEGSVIVMTSHEASLVALGLTRLLQIGEEGLNPEQRKIFEGLRRAFSSRNTKGQGIQTI